jgi:hypothetical protein
MVVGIAWSMLKAKNLPGIF